MIRSKKEQYTLPGGLPGPHHGAMPGEGAHIRALGSMGEGSAQKRDMDWVAVKGGGIKV